MQQFLKILYVQALWFLLLLVLFVFSLELPTILLIFKGKNELFLPLSELPVLFISIFWLPSTIIFLIGLIFNLIAFSSQAKAKAIRAILLISMIIGTLIIVYGNVASCEGLSCIANGMAIMLGIGVASMAMLALPNAILLTEDFQVSKKPARVFFKRALISGCRVIFWYIFLLCILFIKAIFQEVSYLF